MTKAGTVQLLAEHIRPDLEKLRGKKADFLAWQAACSNVEQLEHLVTAHHYHCALENQQLGTAELAARQQKKVDAENALADIAVCSCACSE